ncbi:hypothetical protein ED352_08035 [Muribaculaceae bacterium Isolate-002 (NCI)]|nr:hypothetical protein ED352_08035 [Muribaculaceae bacterium Isolate-002 (NCI)]
MEDKLGNLANNPRYFNPINEEQQAIKEAEKALKEEWRDQAQFTLIIVKSKKTPPSASAL